MLKDIKHVIYSICVTAAMVACTWGEIGWLVGLVKLFIIGATLLSWLVFIIAIYDSKNVKNLASGRHTVSFLQKRMLAATGINVIVLASYGWLGWSLFYLSGIITMYIVLEIAKEYEDVKHSR